MASIPTIPPDRIIHELSDPAAYSHHVDPIRVVQTHVSCVFLTGDFVYKVKKPVQFDFLDYRDAERRRQFCLKEVALNQRLCSEVYLDVVPIVEQDGRLRVNAPGDPVEWAVRMRELRAEEMLPARIASGTVDPADIGRIARPIARFHNNAAAGETIRPFGDPQVIAGNVAGALGSGASQSPAGDDRSPQTIDIFPEEIRAAVAGYLQGFLRDRVDLFHQRSSEGRIRDCHGDLRSQNICLDPRYENGVQIFDCIEFNDQFRYIDVASDLGYLAMDLDLAGRPELREALVGEYERQTHDGRLREMLSFYRCFRATVRGQIAQLAAAESEIPEAERNAHRSMALAAYDLACSYAAGPGAPVLMILMGFSGTGKSALAKELCRRLPAVVLSSDGVRKELAGAAASTRLGADHYTAEARATVYGELRRRADGWLRQGLHVLLDATFLSATERNAAADQARQSGARFRVVELRCPDAEIRRRIRLRAAAGSLSDADTAVYESQLESFDPVQVSPRDRIEHFVLDNIAGPEAAARMVIRRFTGGAPRAAAP